MGASSIMIGSGIVAALMLYLFIKLKESWDGEKLARLSLPKQIEVTADPTTPLLMLISFVIFVFALLLIGKVGYEDYDYCNVVPVNATVTGNLTSYDYERVCFVNTNSSDDGLYNLTNYFLISCTVILVIILLLGLWKYVRDVYDGFQ